MKTGPLLKVSVATAPDADEAVASLLTEVFGESATSYTDASTGRTHAAIYLQNPSAWSAAKRRDLAAGLQSLRDDGVKVGWGRIWTETVAREDWAESWKRHFKPIAIGRALLIKPSWSRRPPQRGQAVVILDPGLSFGTGQHPTTRFCLEEITSARRAALPQTFLDIGTGSGILAIAAVKVGFSRVAAFDIDPDAIRVARANARTNGVGRRIRFSRQDLAQMKAGPAPFDVVSANLTFDLLLRERRRILGQVRPGGSLLLAGILRSQFASVERAYGAAGLTLTRRQRVGEWESGAFTIPFMENTQKFL